MGAESGYKGSIQVFSSEFQLTAFQEYLQALAKDGIFQPNRLGYKTLHFDVEVSFFRIHYPHPLSQTWTSD